MAYIQGGAVDHGGRFFPTKKALKDAVAADPRRVSFYATSPMGPQFHGTLDEIPAGTKLSVVGPDPERSRKWYATVEVKNGQVKVS